MSYSAVLAGSPYPWLAVCALFLGAALARASRRARPRYLGDEPDRARTSKWLFFSLYLSLAVVAALGAIFVPGPTDLLRPRYLYFFAACAALFFLAFRFRRSVGAVTLLLLLALALMAGLFVRSLTAFTSQTEIGRVRVLSARGERMNLEILPARGEPVIREMAGSYFAPVVKVVIFDDLYVFLGARSWYRFEGLTSYALQTTDKGQSFRQQDTDYYFPEAEGIPQRLWELFERNEKRIPGVRSVQVEMDLKKARALATYSLRLQNDGGLQIEPLP
jgi:tRNA(Leu) C34 or U34 (ribose-2'-O)-methylase TrmL